MPVFTGPTVEASYPSTEIEIHFTSQIPMGVKIEWGAFHSKRVIHLGGSVQVGQRALAH